MKRTKRRLDADSSESEAQLRARFTPSLKNLDMLSHIAGFMQDPAPLRMTSKDMRENYLNQVRADLRSTIPLDEHEAWFSDRMRLKQDTEGKSEAEARAEARAEIDAEDMEGTKEVLRIISDFNDWRFITHGQYNLPPAELERGLAVLSRYQVTVRQHWGETYAARIVTIYLRCCKPEYNEVRRRLLIGVVRDAIASKTALWFWQQVHAMVQSLPGISRTTARTSFIVLDEVTALFTPELFADRSQVDPLLNELTRVPTSRNEFFAQWVVIGLPLYNDATGVTIWDMDAALSDGLFLSLPQDERAVEINRMLELYVSRQVKEFKLPVSHGFDINNLDAPWFEQMLVAVSNAMHFMLRYQTVVQLENPNQTWEKVVALLFCMDVERHFVRRCMEKFHDLQTNGVLPNHLIENAIIDNIPVLAKAGVKPLEEYLTLLPHVIDIDWFEDNLVHINRMVDNINNHGKHGYFVEFLGGVLGKVEHLLDPNLHQPLCEMISAYLEDALPFVYEQREDKVAGIDRLQEVEQATMAKPALMTIKHLVAFANRHGVAVRVTNADGESESLPVFLMRHFEEYFAARIAFGFMHQEMAVQLVLASEEERRTVASIFVGLFIPVFEDGDENDEESAHGAIITMGVQNRFYSNGMPRLTVPDVRMIVWEDKEPSVFAAKLLRHQGIDLRLKRQLTELSVLKEVTEQNEELMRKVLALVV